jgi:hypothetical protein
MTSCFFPGRLWNMAFSYVWYPDHRGGNRNKYISFCLAPHFFYAMYFNNSLALVRERSISTDRPPLVGDVSTNFCGLVCHVVSVTNPYGRILGFLDRSRYYFFQVAPQLYSPGWVDPVTDPLLLRKSGSAGNRTRTSGSVASNSDN